MPVLHLKTLSVLAIAVQDWKPTLLAALGRQHQSFGFLLSCRRLAMRSGNQSSLVKVSLPVLEDLTLYSFLLLLIMPRS